MTKPGDLLATKKTIHELAKEFPNKTYQELEKYRDADQQNEKLKEDQYEGKEIDYHRYWKDQYEKERKLRQEAEGELSIVKTISIHSSPEMRDAKQTSNGLKTEIEVLKFRNEKLHNYNNKMTDDNYNLRREIQTLRKQLIEVGEDNKKLSLQITDLTNRLRDANF